MHRMHNSEEYMSNESFILTSRIPKYYRLNVETNVSRNLDAVDDRIAISFMPSSTSCI
ncbi:unnamed protein product [Ixodes pacificus]